MVLEVLIWGSAFPVLQADGFERLQHLPIFLLQRFEIVVQLLMPRVENERLEC